MGSELSVPRKAEVLLRVSDPLVFDRNHSAAHGFRPIHHARNSGTRLSASGLGYTKKVSDIGVCLGLSPGPPAKPDVRSKRGAVRVSSLLSPAAGTYPPGFGIF